MKNVIKWSFGTSNHWYVDHATCVEQLVSTNYDPFTSVIKENTEVRKGVVFLKCPGHTDFLRNMFVIHAPFDLNIDIKVDNEGNGQIYCDNISQEIFENIIDTRFLFDKERGKDPYPIIGIDWLYTFTATEPTLMQFFPAFMHPNDFTNKTMLVPGEFDISKWVRPLEIGFEIKNTHERIEIKKGDAIAYVKFHSSKPIRLEQQPIPWDESKLCADIRKADTFRPLKERYAALAKAKGCPYEHKS